MLVLGCVLLIVVGGTMLAMGSAQGDGPKPPPAITLLQGALPVALWGVAVIAVARWMFGMRVGDLFSHVPGLRWGLLLTSLGVALLGFGLLNVILTVAKGQTVQLTGPVFATLLVVLVIVPFQAMAEELVFRGFALQTVLGKTGVTKARFWVTSVVLGLLFAALHAATKPILFVTLFLFAMLFSYLTLRMAGLEGAIAMHVGNNMVSFAQSALVGTDAAGSSAAPPTLDLILQMLVALVVTAVIARLARRRVTATR